MSTKSKNNALIKALKNALLIPNLVRQAEWARRHSDDLDTDAFYGDATALDFKVNEITNQIRTALAEAQRIK